MKLIGIFAISYLMSGNGCSADYINDTRIVVEGKINSSTHNNSGLTVKLVNEGILVSEGKTKSDGNFRLGGPGTTKNVRLLLNQKINSFSSSEKDCKLDYDSLSIIIPANKSYVNFSNIIVD